MFFTLMRTLGSWIIWLGIHAAFCLYWIGGYWAHGSFAKIDYDVEINMMFPKKDDNK